MKQRMKDQDPFIGRLIAETKIMLIGNEDDLRRLAQERPDQEIRLENLTC